MTKLLVALAAFVDLFFTANSHRCLAYQPPWAHRRLLSPPNLGPTGTASRTSHRQGQEVGDVDVLECNNVVGRRSMLSLGAAAALPLFTSVAPPCFAVVGGAQSAARVEAWPGIELLEPLYELKLSIDAVAAGVEDPENWPSIKKRLEAFFGGFITNEKNFYMGVGLQYMNEMKYDRAELPNYVLLDKETRFGALENTMKYLDSLKSALADSRNNNADTVEDLARASQSSLREFFALIPDRDIKAVDELLANVKKADMNGDGRLSYDELVFLSPAEQEIWKRLAKSKMTYYISQI